MVATSILPKVADNHGEPKEALPRAAKWWYATFHNVTAMVGAGVLSLPHAMAHLGWGPGALALALSWCITLYTLWLMIELHECVPGRRFNRYRELGQYAFGPRLGLWVVVPQQLIVQVGCDVVYMVTGGKCLKMFVEIAFPHGMRLRQSYWICIFGSFQFLLSQFPDLNSIAGVSLAAAVMSLSMLEPRPRRGRKLRLQEDHSIGFHVQGLQRVGSGGVRLRRPRGDTGGPGHHPFLPLEALEAPHVEGDRRGLLHHGALLLPRRAHRVLGVRPGRRRERAHGPPAPPVAHRSGQPHGGHPCCWQLPSLCDAGVRQHRKNTDHATEHSAWNCTSYSCSVCLCCSHTLCRCDISILRGSFGFPGRLRVHSNFLLPTMYDMVGCQKAKEVLVVVAHKLGMHLSGRVHYGSIDCWWLKEYHKRLFYLQLLFLKISITAA